MPVVESGQTPDGFDFSANENGTASVSMLSLSQNVSPRVRTNLRKTSQAKAKFQKYSMAASKPVPKKTFESIFMKQGPLDEIAKRQATKPIESHLKKSLDERRFLAKQRAL